MAKYNKILVAVDGSETSLNALKQSFRLAPEDITVVSVAPSYTGDLRVGGGQNLKALLRAPCETALEKADKLAEAQGVQIKTACMVGEPYECIVDLAESEGCDLIVMGRSGYGFLSWVPVGSNTRRVIGYSPVDVLVVPPHTRLDVGKILLPTDGSESSLKAADRALDFAHAYGSELMVLAVLDLRSRAAQISEDLTDLVKDYVDEVKNEAEKRGIKTEGLMEQGSAFQKITDLAKEEKADLIIMGSRGRTGLNRLLMGSVTEKVIGHSPCPVLVVKK